MTSIVTLRQHITDMVITMLEKVYKKKPEVVNLSLATDLRFGDFQIACFQFAKFAKTSPVEIAKVIALELGSSPDWIFSKVEAIGPYVNLTIKPNLLFSLVCLDLDQHDLFSQISIGHGQKVMVEYLSPNTNKPLHLGHVRNGVLGTALSNILTLVGYNLIKANLINDRGIHICKSMLAWQRWGNGETPETNSKKGDHLVGDYYVKFDTEFKKQLYSLRDDRPELSGKTDKEIDELADDYFFETEIGQAAQAMLRHWEDGNQEIRDIWKMMNQWVYAGFNETYEQYGFSFDRFYYENQTYLLGKDIVQSGIDRGIFVTEENGQVVALLPKDGFGLESGGHQKRITVLRPDGTSVYMTQDIGTAQLKYDDYGLDRSIYIVGSEQNYHFQCLFHILKSLGFNWAHGCFHLSYGMVYLPHGRMKSREGTVVDADNLLEEVIKLAEVQVRSHNENLPCREILKRAHDIALAAIKFFLLRVGSSVDIHFDPEESLSFEGNTGPYCQYAFARACSVMEKAANLSLIQTPNFSLLGNAEERALAQKIIGFADSVKASAEDMSPSKVANYIFDLARAFNLFYEKHKIIDSDNIELTTARFALVRSVAMVLKRGLLLLGIPVLENM